MDQFSAIPPPLPSNLNFPQPNMDEEMKTSSHEMSDVDNLQSVDMSDSEKLALALSCKSEGTRKFQENDTEGACALYKEGVQKLGLETDTHTNSDNNGMNMELEFQNTRVSLNLNLALCYIKMEQWTDAVQASSKVLKIEKNNVKALYRRGFARSRIGFLEEAREDLLQVCKIDTANLEARRELQNVKNKLIKAKDKDKQSFSGLFEKTEGLYDELEKSMQKHRERDMEEKKKEYEKFERINKEKENKGEKPYESFDAWKEEEKKLIKDHKTNQQATQTSTISNKSTSNAVEYDEEEQKILNETKKMGYRYFDRPNKTNESVSKPTPTKINTSQLPTQSSSENTSSLSAWNSKGTTYEERDCSSWFQKKIQEQFKTLSFETSSYTLKITSISEVTGEAQIVVLRAQKRYLYDVNFVLMWNATFKLPDKIQIDGSISLTDVSSSSSNRQIQTIDGNETLPDWLEDAKVSISTIYDQSLYQEGLKLMISQLKKQILNQMTLINEDYKTYA